MPRFFFNVREGEHLVRDPEGQELSDLVEAEFEARLAARDLIVDQLQHDDTTEEREIDITDGDGRVLQTMKVREVLKNNISRE